MGFLVTHEDGSREFNAFQAKDEQAMLNKMNEQFAELSRNPSVKRVEAIKNIGRNASCPCGSGKKFKKCCIEKVKQV